MAKLAERDIGDCMLNLSLLNDKLEFSSLYPLLSQAFGWVNGSVYITNIQWESLLKLREVNVTFIRLAIQD